jgi:hypothetical protein
VSLWDINCHLMTIIVFQVCIPIVKIYPVRTFYKLSVQYMSYQDNSGDFWDIFFNLYMELGEHSNIRTIERTLLPCFNISNIFLVLGLFIYLSMSSLELGCLPLYLPCFFASSIPFKIFSRFWW